MLKAKIHTLGMLRDNEQDKNVKCLAKECVSLENMLVGDH